MMEPTPREEMDPVDTQQQIEIDTLKQTTSNILLTFLMMMLVTFSSLVFAVWTATKPCAHPGCVHHVNRAGEPIEFELKRVNEGERPK